MSKNGQNETLKFSGFSGYYGSLPDGYGGFDWGALDYLNAQASRDSQQFETGYQTPLQPQSEAILPGSEGGVSYGVFESASVSSTFSLKSMLAASGGATGEQVEFRSYTYAKAKGFDLKASDTVTLGQKWQKIDFASLGHGDFQNIAAVAIIVSNSQYYGGHRADAPGYVLAFTNLKVHWNGKIPTGYSGGHSALAHMPHVILPHLDVSSSDTGAPQHDPENMRGENFHTMINSLGGFDPAGGLTSQFALPHVEHFGS